jgi:hypothetical protein
MMQRSQWECLLENLGVWQGTFTQLSVQGEIIESVKSETILAGLAENKSIRQTIRKFYPEGTKENILEYQNLARSVLFFDNGAFSHGSTQFSPLDALVAELGLIDRDRQRRIRVVSIHKMRGALEKFTVIVEGLAEKAKPELPPLTLAQLLGTWQGESTTIYADLRSPETFSSTLEIDQIDQRQLQQKLTFANQEISSIGAISSNRLLFDSATSAEVKTVQVLFLPDGASVACPLQLYNKEPFGLELGWLITPTLRHRIRRSYDSIGAWDSLTLTVEQKIA